MPQFGRIALDTIAAIEANGAAPAAPWPLPRVTAQVVTFEVDVDGALDHLPAMLARPAPPYARILVLDVPESPVGPYREAQLLVSCRYLMLPRQYLAASVVTSPAAAAGAARNWHYHAEVGEVSLSRTGSDFIGEVRTASGVRITIASPAAQVTSPTVIRYDPTVIARSIEGTPTVVTVSAEPGAVHDAWLAVGTTVEYSGGSRTDPWLRLRSRNPITCTIAVADFVLPEPKAVPRPGQPG